MDSHPSGGSASGWMILWVFYILHLSVRSHQTHLVHVKGVVNGSEWLKPTHFLPSFFHLFGARTHKPTTPTVQPRPATWQVAACRTVTHLSRWPRTKVTSTAIVTSVVNLHHCDTTKQSENHGFSWFFNGDGWKLSQETAIAANGESKQEISGQGVQLLSHVLTAIQNGLTPTVMAWLAMTRGMLGSARGDTGDWFVYDW